MLLFMLQFIIIYNINFNTPLPASSGHILLVRGDYLLFNPHKSLAMRHTPWLNEFFQLGTKRLHLVAPKAAKSGMHSEKQFPPYSKKLL